MKRILVTTVKRCTPVEESGMVYIYDLDKNKIVNKCGMFPLNARFARNPRGGIRGLRGACIDEEEEKIYIASNDIITVLNYDLEMLYTIEHKLFCNLHEIKKEKDVLIVASCGNDKILEVNRYGTVKVIWEKDDNYACFSYNKIDSHGSLRPNSVSRYFGNGLYVAFAKLNEICYVDLSLSDRIKFEKLDTVVNTPHNIFIKQDLLNTGEAGVKDIVTNIYFNSSKDSKFCRYNHDTHETTVLFEDKKKWYFRNTDKIRWGWLRGLDRFNDCFLIGSSPYARVIRLYVNPVNDRVVFKKIIKLSNYKYESVYSALFFKKDLL